MAPDSAAVAAAEQVAARAGSPAAKAPELLRFATAGSVDDGKSTLIGRLLYDAKALMADQEADLADLARLTDGLRAEREQGITIDVAYRYFATARRRFILAEGLEVPSLYLAHEREVFARDGMLYAVSPYLERMDGEEPFVASVRYRTVGDMSCTGAVRSTACTLEDVVAEIAATRVTERGETRADDRTSEAAMEDRKREGYF